MTDFVLHHFDWSPYAEKVRVLLGVKGVAWRSVQIPLVMPKPDLTALTGGYRKTPVLQIGADIYCDSSLIALELERRSPHPTLFPDGAQGLTLALSAWAGRFFDAGAGLSMGLNDELPADLVQDRREFFTHMDFARFRECAPHLFGQVRAHASLVDSQLADGRDFLLGSRPGLADATAYYVLWMARGFVAAMGDVLQPFERMARWEARVRAIGHGVRTEMTADAALELARQSRPSPARGVDAADPLGLAAGVTVDVTPDDYGKTPVQGVLVTLQSDEIAVRRTDERAGEVIVHFPRVGYCVERAA
jgi:glutathione S-transferase